MAFAPPLVRPLAAEVDADPGVLRIGIVLCDVFLGAPIDADCRVAVERTAKLLEAAGHHVEESFPAAFTGPTGLGPLYRGVVSASNVAGMLDRWSARIGRAIREDEVEPYTWERAQLGRTVTGVQIHAAVARINAGIGRTPEWWEQGFDLLVTPTRLAPLPRVGSVCGERAPDWSARSAGRSAGLLVSRSWRRTSPLRRHANRPRFARASAVTRPES